MRKQLNITILETDDHLEVLQDGIMVAKRESIDKILSDGEVFEFYENWVYPVRPDCKEHLGEIIIGLLNGDYAKVE
jgi:hypothetical protein